MFIFIFFGYFFFCLGLMIIFFSIFFIEKMIILDLSLMNKKYLEIMFFFDWLSLSFLGFLLMMSGSVYIFGNMYMEKDILMKRFFFLLTSFIMSMIFLIFLFSKFFWLLVGWDGLGVSSVLLMLFYTANSSMSSGLKTFLMKRLGDGLLIFSLILFSLKGHLDFFSLDLVLSLSFFFFFVLGCFTKSSQFPFSSWLPVAMAAPTPVSALVHSSTLVTAGVYLLIRFKKKMKEIFIFMGLLLSLLTLFMASFAALVEWDSKKMVAFSTLSQLGLMLICLFLGLIDVCYFHLMVHAFFKSLMFVLVGFLLLKKYHFQDIRLLSKLFMKKYFLIFVMLFVNFCLSGFFFFGSFYMKDLIYEKKFFIKKKIFIFFFYLSLVFTFLYSFRFFFILFFFKKSKISNEKNKMNMKNNMLSMNILLIFSLIIGWYFFFFFEKKMMYNFCNFKKKIFMFMLVFFSIIMSFFFYSMKKLKKWFFFNLLFLEFLKSSYMNKKLLSLGKFIYSFFDNLLMNFMNMKKIIYKKSLTMNNLLFYLKKINSYKYLFLLFMMMMFIFI